MSNISITLDPETSADLEQALVATETATPDQFKEIKEAAAYTLKAAVAYRELVNRFAAALLEIRDGHPDAAEIARNALGDIE
jgi:hypothetical protein